MSVRQFAQVFTPGLWLFDGGCGRDACGVRAVAFVFFLSKNRVLHFGHRTGAPCGGILAESILATALHLGHRIFITSFPLPAPDPSNPILVPGGSYPSYNTAKMVAFSLLAAIRCGVVER